MGRENRFNLIDEPWVPIVGHGLASLRQIFTQPEYRAIGGNPIEKIALTKLLLAIAQAAYTPADDDDWERNGSTAIVEHALAYLEKWHDRFWLYGEKPFLQMPTISKAKVTSFGSVLAHVSTGNTTVLSEVQIEKQLVDHEKAMLVLVQMGFALGGKKTDNSVALTKGYSEKKKTGKAGANIGFMGFMHTFMLGNSILESLWLNLLCDDYLQAQTMYKEGLGCPPWEAMPVGEDCATARLLKKSLMGRLVPLSRFCLLTDHGLHYSEGITHLGYADGLVDPSVSVNFLEKKVKVLWINPDKRPWRYLTALLSFLDTSQGKYFDCIHLRVGLNRVRGKVNLIGIWSGGLKITSNAGEQYVSGHDDFVESSFKIPADETGTVWYQRFSHEMKELDYLSKVLYSATLNYYKSLNMNGEDLAKKACHTYWQLCERKFQELVNTCQNENLIKNLRKEFSGTVNNAYSMACPRNTARQIDAWASNRPNLNKYLG